MKYKIESIRINCTHGEINYISMGAKCLYHAICTPNYTNRPHCDFRLEVRYMPDSEKKKAKEYLNSKIHDSMDFAALNEICKYLSPKTYKYWRQVKLYDLISRLDLIRA